MTITIRPIIVDDKEDVLSIASRISLNYFEKVFDFWVNSPQNLFYGIFIDDDLIGMADIFFHALKEAWLQGIRINPEYQRQGLAFKLVDHLENLCTNRSVKIIRFNTAPQNDAMIKLGKKRGYKETGDWIVYRVSAGEIKQMLNNSEKPDKIPYNTLHVTPISLFFSQYNHSVPPNGLLFSDFRTYTWQSIHNKTPVTHPIPYLVVSSDQRAGISVQDMSPELHQTSLLGTTIGFGWGAISKVVILIKLAISQKLEEGYKKFRIGLPLSFEAVFSAFGFNLSDPNYPIFWKVFSKELGIKERIDV
ncbi:MAG: GNAT family N-acetyltransferase [Candidatus Hodarchaeota archaeon]